MAIFKILDGKAVRFDEGSGLSDIDNATVDFSQAESRENISPSDSMKIILGKIMKWFSDLSGGAASTLLGKNLTAGKVLVSDDDGKVSASETDASEVTYFYGSSDEVNAALEAGDLEVGTNIYCEDDTEFEPSYNITEDRVVITNADGEFAPSDVTATELEYLSGVTGNVQEQINSIANNTDQAVFDYIAKKTTEEIKNYYDHYSDNLQDNTWYHFVVSHGAFWETLGGGRWFVEGFKATDSYEWQLARTYSTLANGGMRYRVKEANAWKEWEKVS